MTPDEIARWVTGAHFALATVAWHALVRYTARASDGATALEYWTAVRRGLRNRFLSSIKDEMRGVLEGSKPTPSPIHDASGNPIYKEKAGDPLASEFFTARFTVLAEAKLPEVADLQAVVRAGVWHDRWCAVRMWTSLALAGGETFLTIALGVLLYLLNEDLSKPVMMYTFVLAAVGLPLFFVSLGGVGTTEATLRRLQKSYHEL